MKTFAYTGLAAILLTCFTTLNAQDTVNVQSRYNVIKFHPENLIFGSVSLGYERALNEKNSIDIGIGFPRNRSIDEEFYEDIFEEDLVIDEANFKTFHLRAAFRHYTGKKGVPSGFYYEPFLKYQNSNTFAKGAYINKPGIRQGTVDGDIKTFSLGFQLGYQFLIGKRVTLDLYFLGLEAGLGTVDIDTKVPPEHVDDVFVEIKDFINDLPSFVVKKIEVNKMGETIKVKGSDLLYPWARVGVSVGIAF